MSHIFLYVERGIFVEGYILNSDVLCFTQDIDDEKKVLIVEKNKKFNIDADCFKFIKKCCMVYGHSYTMQRQFVIDIFNYYIKTPIIVSVDEVPLFLIIVIAIAKQIENKVAPHIGSIPPNNIPTAIPVNAPCPNESAKKDILLLTTIVLNNPNNGVIIIIAIKAFFIKV